MPNNACSNCLECQGSCCVFKLEAERGSNPLIGVGGRGKNQVKIKSWLQSYITRGRKLTHKRGREFDGLRLLF
jgi:hypothetical protein